MEEGKPSHRWGTSPDLTIHICHCPTTDHCATLLLLLLYHTHTQCCPAEARVGQELVFAGCSLGGVVGSGSGHSLDNCHQPNTSAPPPPPETTHQLRPDLGKDLAEEKSNLVLEIFWRGFAFSKTKKPVFFSNSCHLSSGDSETWWQPAAICRQHVFWGGQTTNSQCLQIVNVHK